MTWNESLSCTSNDCCFYPPPTSVQRACGVPPNHIQNLDVIYGKVDWSHVTGYYLNGAVTAVVVLVGLVLNLVCVLVFLWPKITRSREHCPIINYYLIAIAIWDCVLLLPGAFLMYSVPTLMFGRVVPMAQSYTYLLPMVYYTSNLSLIATIWVALALGIDRYLALNYPLQHKRLMTRNRALTILVLVSVLAVICCAPFVLHYTVSYCRVLRASTCQFDLWDPVLTDNPIADLAVYRIGYRVMISLVICQLAPLAFLVFLTVRLTTHLSSQSRIRGELMSGSCHVSSPMCHAESLSPRGTVPSPDTLLPKTERNQLLGMAVRNSMCQGAGRAISRVSITANLTQWNDGNGSTVNMHNTILIKFILCRCFLPILTLLENILPDTYDQNNIISLIVQVSNLVIVLNSATNFFVYVYFSPKFRRSLEALFTCNTSKLMNRSNTDINRSSRLNRSMMRNVHSRDSDDTSYNPRLSELRKMDRKPRQNSAPNAVNMDGSMV